MINYIEEITYVFGPMDDYTIRRGRKGDTIMGPESHKAMYYFWHNNIESMEDKMHYFEAVLKKEGTGIKTSSDF
jgi:hypothetical protein